MILTAQQKLRESFDPFFIALHDCLKQIDKSVRRRDKALVEKAKADGKRNTTDRQTKALKTALEDLHTEVKNAESSFAHIHWRQERFPEARYEDVTGLCRLADMDAVKEQDYSLNPGRYVGVVFEEDGKTEEEFIDELLAQQNELDALQEEAGKLQFIIAANTKTLGRR